MNSVVVADVPPYAVAAGNPARILHRTPPPTPSPS
jgi:acetyltransferase-like isoleucine patch superfamily enzyme